MTYCLNPNCPKAENPDNYSYCQSCGAKLIPLLLNRFRIVKRIGQGGFGKTYIALDEHRMRANCVIKQFSPALEMQQQMQRNPQLHEKMLQLFEREAKQLLELGQHSQIPTLFAYFEANLEINQQQYSYLYLAQDYIHGQNLLEEVEAGHSFQENDIRELLTDLLQILQFVHEKTVIHRDINPENIMRRTPQTPLTKAGLLHCDGRKFIIVLK